MTMTVDSQQRQFGGMNFDHMPYSNPPHFTNPWTSTSAAGSSHNLYAPSQGMNPNLGLDTMAKQRINNNVSMPSYASVPITAASADLLSPSRMQNTSTAYGNDVSYTTGASSAHATYVTSTPYDSMGYAPAPVRSTFALQQQQQQPQADNTRRLSQPGMANESTRSFGDAIDASRGMIAMSQNTTPRNIYGPGARTGRGSSDSYGFPSTHSTSSSISSSTGYPSYFGGSVDSSVSDYSNAGSDIESVSSRTLPRPSGLLNGGIPPAPQSMMGQFSSKVSSSTQKKHKCKVCDKRFTRPSSLQTHMYSHTGEKPFSCEVEGCGRHFSVVSNLRRHRKVHKGDARSEAGSDDHQSDD